MIGFVTTSDGDTFTVGELRKMLEGEDDDTPVYINLVHTGVHYEIKAGSYGKFINGQPMQNDTTGGYAELMAWESVKYPPKKRD